jgi:glycosyltransferase involved in cell wall biosynthesis
MKVLLVANYENNHQQSMRHFAEMLGEGLVEMGHEVRLGRPPAWLGRLRPGESGLGKWLGYIDRFVLYLPLLQRQVQWADVVHICDQANAVYVPHLRNKPHVVTCHDMLAIRAARGEFPESAVGWTGRIYRRWILNALRKAQRVACVSRQTYKDVQRIAGIQEDRMILIPNGFNYPYRPMIRDEAATHLNTLGLHVDTPFFLHVGGNEWYKNRQGVLQLFSELAKYATYKTYRLVMAGKPWTEEMHRTVVSLQLVDRVIEQVDVSNEQLRALYSRAEALLFPSLHEGFGWPIVEAQACGCPVVTTNRPPMNDVGGSAALYIDPEDPQRAAKQIVSKLRQRKRWFQDGLDNAARFSTKGMISDYVQCYWTAIKSCSSIAELQAARTVAVNVAGRRGGRGSSKRESVAGEISVLVISHSYMAPENQKNILALARFLNVLALVPKATNVPLFGRYKHVPMQGVEEFIYAHATLPVLSDQYVFLSLRLAPKTFRPDAILVEYNPWSLMFVQAWIYKVLFARNAKLICFVKKNTYRRYEGIRGGVKDWLADSVVKKVDCFIAASKKVSRMLQHRFGEETRIVSVEQHLGVDAGLFCPRYQDGDRVGRGILRRKLVIGYCGRLDEDKGVTDLIEAVGSVRGRTGWNIEVSVVGRGALDQSLRSICKQQPWVMCAPPIAHAEVAGFLQTLDVFVLASRPLPDHEEHDAHALLEAMSCGVACIVTAVGINAELVSDDSGIVVPSNDITALENAIEKVVMDPLERERIGRGARRAAVRQYSIEAVARRKIRVLKNVVEGCVSVEQSIKV